MDGDDSCSSCRLESGEASLIMRRKDRRLWRMAPLVIVPLLLLTAGVVVLLVIGLGRQGDLSPDGKTEKQTDRNSSGVHPETSGPPYQHPSAMLTAGNNSYLMASDYLQWESVIGNVHCHGGFNYSNGDLVVPRKGMYRVFLQITFIIECKEDSKTERKVWNNVYVYSDAYEADTILLSSVDMVACRGHLWYKSMYTAGLFSLDANDRLRVKSSDPKLIARNEHEVLFGAELLQ
ncbi:lymphotoxin-alpha-like [Parambassis ranga]|uniref:Lymphotoxin-alpha-like n=1 Tax=Parambassis ranga TaxID=210632 RepID=A0A6P7J384_9TELE|nr:lymphotoxin-alpha-like [Parambassis ranga]